jgi:anti-sigma B factor antagonist
VILSIAGEMTIYRAGELKQELLAALAREQQLDVDLSQVSELDTAGVQVLLVTKQAAIAQHKQLRLVGHSAAVLDVFSVLNLSSTFGDPLPLRAAAENPP